MRNYITTDEVFNRVQSSLKTYFDRDVILAEEYYKVIEHCNSVLGLRLNPNKEIFESPINHQIKLPKDFLLLNMALGADVRKVSNTVSIKKETLVGREPLPSERMDIRCGKISISCGKIPELVVEQEDITTTYEEVRLLNLTEKKYASNNCLNLNSGMRDTIVIKDGIFYTDLDNCIVYINYVSKMEEDGIPICLDHPKVMLYYEKALKYEMLIDLMVNKKLEIVQIINLARQEMVAARNDAISLVTTPEYDEMMAASNALRRLFRRYQFI